MEVKKMKQLYTAVSVKVLHFGTQDVITESNVGIASEGDTVFFWSNLFGGEVQ